MVAEMWRPAAEKQTGKLIVTATCLARFHASLSLFSGGQWIVENTLTQDGDRRGPLVEMMQRQVAVEKLTPPHWSIWGENDERAARVALRDLGVGFVVIVGRRGVWRRRSCFFFTSAVINQLVAVSSRAVCAFELAACFCDGFACCPCCHSRLADGVAASHA